MKINNILFLLIIILPFSCSKSKILNQRIEGGLIESQEIEDQTEISYDTLDGIYLYESYVESYITGEDAVTKVGGMIDGSVSVSLRSYKEGYYVIDISKLIKERENYPSLDFNPTTINPLQSRLEEIFWTHSGYSDTDFHPYCGLYYKKFYLKAVVVNIGKVCQKTPLFLDCEDFMKYRIKNRGVNYEYNILSTYLVTDVMEWREIE